MRPGLLCLPIVAALLTGLAPPPDWLRDSEWRMENAVGGTLLKNSVGGLCIGRARSAAPLPGSRVTLADCGGLFGLRPEGVPGETMAATFQDALSRLCLSVEGGERHAPHALVTFNACRDAAGRVPREAGWRAERLASGAYHLRNLASKLCLGVRGNDAPIAGALVEVYACSSPPVPRAGGA